MRESSFIHENIATLLLSTLASKGCDASELEAKFGLLSGDQECPGVWPLAKFTAVLEAAAAEKGDPLFGLKLAKAFGLNGLGPVAPLLRTCKTAGDAFTKFTRYFPSFQTNTEYGFGISGDTARLSYKITDPTIKFRLQDAIFTIALEQSIMSELRGMEICPEFIDFQHLPMSENEANDYRAFFDCDVRFGRNENAIAFPAASLSEARSSVDSRSGERLEADLVNSIQSKAKHIELSISIEAWMTAALSAGESIDLERAAGDFG